VEYLFRDLERECVTGGGGLGSLRCGVGERRTLRGSDGLGERAAGLGERGAGLGERAAGLGERSGEGLGERATDRNMMWRHDDSRPAGNSRSRGLGEYLPL